MSHPDKSVLQPIHRDQQVAGYIQESDVQFDRVELWYVNGLTRERFDFQRNNTQQAYEQYAQEAFDTFYRRLKSSPALSLTLSLLNLACDTNLRGVGSYQKGSKAPIVRNKIDPFAVLDKLNRQILMAKTYRRLPDSRDDIDLSLNRDMVMNSLRDMAGIAEVPPQPRGLFARFGRVLRRLF